MSILVTGATSQIGAFLLPRLVSQGFQVHALSRTPPFENGPGVVWHRANIEAGELPNVAVDSMIHLAPLPLLPALLPRVVGGVGDSTSSSHLPTERSGSRLKRVIAFGSTSRFSKQTSTDAVERAFAFRLAQAEQAIASYCEPLGIRWTVFRPTLIYGCGMDKNITVIARFIRRFGFFPLIGETRGLRQPVHADDLALACLAALDHPAAFDRAYDLSGGEILSYRQMVERIFKALGKPSRFVRIPPSVFQGLMKIASLLPQYRYLSAAMARRMNDDLRFDHGEASRDFGYSPRAFEPNAANLTPRGFHANHDHWGGSHEHD